MASYGHYLTIPGLVATGTVTQFKAVKLGSTANSVKLVDAYTDIPVGILMNDPADGEVAEVAAWGDVKAAFGASVTKGVRVGINSTGQIRAASTTTAAPSIGIALEASSSAGELHPVLLTGLAVY
jgi:hypothetical protein